MRPICKEHCFCGRAFTANRDIRCCNCKTKENIRDGYVRGYRKYKAKRKSKYSEQDRAKYMKKWEVEKMKGVSMRDFTKDNGLHSTAIYSWWRNTKG